LVVHITFSYKALTSNLLSTKEDLVKLRQLLRHLRCRSTENDATCALGVASALWEKWLSLLEAAREWQQWGGELKREWKFISEEVSPLPSPGKPCSPQ
jgi:nesprin-2